MPAWLGQLLVGIIIPKLIELLKPIRKRIRRKKGGDSGKVK